MQLPLLNLHSPCDSEYKLRQRRHQPFPNDFQTLCMVRPDSYTGVRIIEIALAKVPQWTCLDAKPVLN